MGLDYTITSIDQPISYPAIPLPECVQWMGSVNQFTCFAKMGLGMPEDGLVEAQPPPQPRSTSLFLTELRRPSGR
ncbi:hypothetical protein C2W62_39535 [Candidatus Entotheonella serta]|nr:hypothetical protein C2W62_39535 [Candidatus Entotheonella serta]